MTLLRLSGFCLILFLAACAGSPSGQGAGGRSARPDWIRDPHSIYNRQEYLAFVGSGNTRQEAERNALRSLVAFFGQDIQIDERIHHTYQQALRDGVIAGWSDLTTADITMVMAAGMDNLVGAETREAWVDPDGTHYVIAVLNKAMAARVYSEMVRANLSMINNLTNIPAAERNTLNSYARFRFAAAIADVTAGYANLLRQIGFPVQEIRQGDEYRLEAAAILDSIPIHINVAKEAHVDRAGRINGAFARALSDLGFRSGGGSRYALDVNVSLSPVTIPNSPFFWSRIELSANLTDTATGNVLLPFNFDSRVGYTSRPEADNRAILAAEQRINEEYANLLREYLYALLPGRLR